MSIWQRRQQAKNDCRRNKKFLARLEKNLRIPFLVGMDCENGASIEWASDDESAIVISDGTATVICDPDSEKTVKLTVAVSKGEFSVSKEITVVVGILIPKDTPANSIIIKEIRVCKAEDYE